MKIQMLFLHTAAVYWIILTILTYLKKVHDKQMNIENKNFLGLFQHTSKGLLRILQLYGRSNWV